MYTPVTNRSGPFLQSSNNQRGHNNLALVCAEVTGTRFLWHDRPRQHRPRVIAIWEPRDSFSKWYPDTTREVAANWGLRGLQALGGKWDVFLRHLVWQPRVGWVGWFGSSLTCGWPFRVCLIQSHLIFEKKDALPHDENICFKLGPCRASKMPYLCLTSPQPFHDFDLSKSLRVFCLRKYGPHIFFFASTSSAQ